MIVAQAHDGSVLGFAAVHLLGAFIHHLYIDPALTGHGIKSATVVLAGRRGISKCQVRNARSLRCYHRESWTEGETGDGRWINGD